MCANIILNRLDNYYAYNSAVGEKSGEIEIPEIDYEKNLNVGAFSIEREYRQMHGIESSMKEFGAKVPLVVLDDLKVRTSPALIKMDVEGF